jgi:hypothetical protein
MWVGFQEIWSGKTNTQNEVTKIGSCVPGARR